MEGLTKKIDEIRRKHDWGNDHFRCKYCQIKEDYFEKAMSDLKHMNRVGEDSDEYIENLLKGYICKRK